MTIRGHSNLFRREIQRVKRFFVIGTSRPCQAQKLLHFPGDPLVFVVNDLAPDLHMKIGHIQGGEPSGLNIFFYGEKRQKREAGVLP